MKPDDPNKQALLFLPEAIDILAGERSAQTQVLFELSPRLVVCNRGGPCETIVGLGGEVIGSERDLLRFESSLDTEEILSARAFFSNVEAGNKKRTGDGLDWDAAGFRSP